MSFIDLAQKGIFKNCIEVRKNEEGYLPVRFTQEQLDLYSKQDNFRIRRFCPAGVCMDFYTDSTFFELEFSTGEECRDWLYFDIYLNDVLVESIGSRPISRDITSVHYNLPSDCCKLNRVTIYLPQTLQVVVKGLRLSEGAAVEEAKGFNKNLLCLGDSITQGMEAIHPSSTYPVLLSRFLGMNLLNHGIGGYYFDASSLDRELPYKPDIITVAYGTNDWGKFESLDEFEQNCSRYIAKLIDIYPASRIFVITPFWRSDLDQVKNTGSFFDIINTISKVCGKYPQINLINGLELIPHIPDYFGDLYLHPSDEGFLHIAMNLVRKMSNLLNMRD